MTHYKYGSLNRDRKYSFVVFFFMFWFLFVREERVERRGPFFIWCYGCFVHERLKIMKVLGFLFVFKLLLLLHVRSREGESEDKSFLLLLLSHEKEEYVLFIVFNFSLPCITVWQVIGWILIKMTWSFVQQMGCNAPFIMQHHFNSFTLCFSLFFYFIFYFLLF